MNPTCTLTNLNTRIRSSTLYANARTPLDSIWSNFRRRPEKGHLQPQVSEKVECQLVSVDRVIDATSLDTFSGLRLSVVKNEVAEVTIQARSPLVMDNHERVATSGRFVIVDHQDVAGGGIIFGGTYVNREPVQSTNIFSSEGTIDHRIRTERNGHTRMVLSLPRPPRSRKSKLAPTSHH